MATLQLSPQNGKYLTFQLSRQYFAIRSDRVRHILPVNGMRPCSQGPSYLYGLIAMNGHLLPVLDLRGTLRLPVRPLRATAVVLVLTLELDYPLGMLGLVVDKLSELVEFRDSEIRGSTAQLRIQGRPYGRPKTVLQPEAILTHQEWERLRTLIPPD